MTYVHLPAEHSEEDLALAGALAEQLECGELFVAWSRTGGSARPVVSAAVRRPAPAARRPRGLAALLEALRRRLPRA